MKFIPTILEGNKAKSPCHKLCGVSGALLALSAGLLHSNLAEAQGRLSIVPYASVSSSKSIKPNKVGKDKAETSTSSTENVNQRTTYGLKIDIRLLSFLAFNVQGGVNKVDKTKKVSGMRDEFKEINIVEDLNLDPDNQKSEYRYQEEQRLATAKLMLTPRLGSFLWLKAGAGVRARQRLITVTDKVSDESQKIKDPIRYHAVGTAGVGVRLFRSMSAQAEYNFYFMKFPEVEPHEQEVAVGFGISI
jgi:hypothetical protein